MELHRPKGDQAMLTEPDASTTMVTALLNAVVVLVPVTDPGRATAPLRRLLAELLLTEPLPDTTTPSTGEVNGVRGCHTERPLKPAPSEIVRRTARRPGVQAAPRSRAPSKETPATGDPDWLDLRRRTQAEQQRRGLDRDGLARELAVSPSTLRAVMGKRSRPSDPIVRRILAFLAGPGAAQAAGPGNGAASLPTAPRPALASAAAPEVAVPRPAPFRIGGDALAAGTG